MCHVIPKGTTNNDQRTLDFFVGTTANPLAPKTSGVAGVAPRLRFGDNALETGDNTIAAISAADGWYRYTLSDAEANNDVGLASLFLDASDVADIAPVREPFQIGASDVLSAASTPEEIATATAAANRDDAIQMLVDGMTLGDTSWTLKNSAGDTVTVTITRLAKNSIASTAVTP